MTLVQRSVMIWMLYSFDHDCFFFAVVKDVVIVVLSLTLVIDSRMWLLWY
jgi:hypothetical protein